MVNGKIQQLKVLTIAATGTTSGILDARDLIGVTSLALIGPAAATGTLAVQVAAEDPSVNPGTAWVALHSPPGTAVTLPAGAAVIIAPGAGALPIYGLRVVSSQAEAAARTIRVVGGK